MNSTQRALFLVALSAPVSFAGPLGGEPTMAEEAWPALDAALAAPAFTTARDGVDISGWIKTDYRNSSDTDTGDFGFNSVRANLTGAVGDASYKVSVELGGGAASLRDAFVKFPVAAGVSGTLGTFKTPFLFSGLSPFTGTVFYDRTAIGGDWAGRDAGFALSGAVDRFGWTLCAQDGGDGPADDLHLTARATYDLFDGAPGIRKWAGGHGTDAPRQVTLGVSYLDEQSIDDGGALALEVMAHSGPFWFHAESVDFGDGFVDGVPASGNTGRSAGRAGTTPYDVTLAYAVSADYEVALRYEDFDDGGGGERVRAGVTRFIDGHGLKWGLDWAETSTDDGDSDAITVGLTAAW
ncbi:MAG: hypothetical protein QF860_11945 [Planctomycetota bacterium]|jgi:hypothetical protein|nr:hypothetical protein [Planctomycetota bacterium]